MTKPSHVQRPVEVAKAPELEKAMSAPMPPPAPPRTETPEPPAPRSGPAPMPPPPAAAKPAPRAAAMARPPGPRPVKLRYWVLALTVLWAIWLWAKPATKRIDARIEQAAALAKECKSKEAQAELIALRRTSATDDQLRRLQQSLNDSAAVCERKQTRTKAWNETIVAVNNAMASAAWDKAQARLGVFTRRWGEDAETRELKARIAAEKASAQKAQTERQKSDMAQCLLEGGDWVNGRCS